MLKIFQLELDDMRYGLMSSIQSKIFCSGLHALQMVVMTVPQRV